MRMCVTFVLLCVFNVTAGLMYYRPYEYRSVPSDMESNAFSSSHSNIQSNSVKPQILHTQSKPVLDKVHTYSNSFNDIRLSKSDEKNLNSKNEDVARASLGFTKPALEPPRVPIPCPEQSLFLDPAESTEDIDKVTPKFGLLEPVIAKMSNKVTGLMDLVLALTGSNSNNFIMKGFKHILIDGVIKPMMLAKGGLKVLISKLSIPLISLVLINIEVLITVWWLWEDCMDQTKPVLVNEPVNTLADTAFKKPFEEVN